MAWAAGLFEGEGSVTVDSDGGICLQINMTDLEPLQRFAQVVGGRIGGPYNQSRAKPNWKPFWKWRVRGVEAHVVFQKMAPWLGERRRNRYAEVCKSEGIRRRESGSVRQRRAAERRALVGSKPETD